MNKIKDFIYDKNDLVIALLIVVAAAFIITSRIDVIMAYPATLASESGNPSGEIVANLPEDPQGDPAGSGSPSQSEDPVGQADGPEAPPEGPAGNSGSNTNVSQQTTGEPAVSQVSIYIEYGSNGSDIAQLLVDSGLIASKEIFYDAVAAAGADTKLQAGSFKIPSNATPAEIVRIITN